MTRASDAAAQIGKKSSIIEKIPAEDLRDAEDKMPVGNLFEDIHAQPFPEFHHPLLMAGGAEMTALAGESQKIFMVTVTALRAGKAVVQVAAVQITLNDLLEIGAPETVLPFEPFLIDLDKGFKMIFHTPVIIRRLRISGAINGGGSRHDFSPLEK
jgi:hypothetical protein